MFEIANNRNDAKCGNTYNRELFYTRIESSL